MENIVVIGGGGHAKVVISILKKLKKYEIIGFIDIEKKSDILGISWLGSDENLSELFATGVKNAAIGIGQIKSAELRKKIFKNLIEIGYKLPPIISCDAIINEDVKIGAATVVMDGVVINASVCIGNCSIINTKVSIDHDCTIGNFSHIAPGATLSGNVTIGDSVLVGAGACVIQGVIVPDGCLISAGSAVFESIQKVGVYRGTPSKFIREV